MNLLCEKGLAPEGRWCTSIADKSNPGGQTGGCSDFCGNHRFADGIHRLDEKQVNATFRICE
jgi:hypothetical protein